MKNKWDQLKKDWKIWKDLKRGSTGLGWDPIKRTIDASEEWWAERLAVVPAAKKYKTCGIEPELEEKLDQMFGGVVATGKYACAPSETGFGETQDNVAVSLSDDSPEFPSAGPTEIQSTNRSKRSRFESKKKGGAATIRNQISCLMDSSNDAPHKVQKTSINEVVAILEQDPSIAADDELYYFAHFTSISLSLGNLVATSVAATNGVVKSDESVPNGNSRPRLRRKVAMELPHSLN
ncbi:uncharacterized protein LOC110024141 [Phalaenopsis equestris]|uniref:uncharacterized protein LOC110024141 n=1 Tax=Phalaenopsis equestris TaxID=78828 RepID=UPI0009E291C6|nr:uncharacterized protein LOC110024141 [Phalaenopsis equestris]